MKRTIKHLKSLDTVSAKPSVMMTSMGSGIFDESGDFESGQMGSGDYGGEQIEAGSVPKLFNLTILNNGTSSNISFTIFFSWTGGSITGNPKQSEISFCVGDVSSNGDIIYCSNPTLSKPFWGQGYNIRTAGYLSYEIYKRNSEGNLMYDENDNLITQTVRHNLFIDEPAPVTKINENH